MCPEGYPSENSRPQHTLQPWHWSPGAGSSDSPGAASHVFGAGAGPGGAGSQEKLTDEPVCSHPACQLKGNRTPLPQPKQQLLNSSCLVEFDHYRDPDGSAVGRTLLTFWGLMGRVG